MIIRILVSILFATAVCSPSRATEKLMTYALGRELEIGDRPATDIILAELKSTEGGLGDLIRLLIRGETFARN